MTLFQIILLLATAFFAYQVYMHIQNIDENAEPMFGQEPEQIEAEPTADERIEEADRAYMDGDIDKARTLLEETVVRFPDLPEAMNKLAFILAKQGDTQAAEEQYRASLAIAPDDDVTHNALATVLVSMDKEDQAQEHYKQALDIDDNYEVTWFNYANLMQKMGQIEKAKEMYEKALQIDPNFEPAREELGKLQ
jgi:Tfp pilus assembly protein PilF